MEEDAFAQWLQRIEGLGSISRTDVDWRKHLLVEAAKDTSLQACEVDDITRAIQECMSRSTALVSSTITKVVCISSSDPTADNIPDRHKCYIQMKGDWKRPCGAEGNDSKLWSKLATSLVRDTIDSTLVVISTDLRNTSKGRGRKIEMHCRCAGKNRSKDGGAKRRKASKRTVPRVVNAPHPPASPEATHTASALFSGTLFDSSYSEYDYEPAHAQAHTSPSYGFNPGTLSHPNMLSLSEPDELPEDIDMIESDEVLGHTEPDNDDVIQILHSNRCLARAVLLVDVVDDSNSSGAFVLKLHLMHTHKCKHMLLGQARKEAESCQTFLSGFIAYLESIKRSLKSHPSFDMLDAIRHMRSRINVPAGPPTVAKLQNFVRQLSDPFDRPTNHELAGSPRKDTVTRTDESQIQEISKSQSPSTHVQIPTSSKRQKTEHTSTINIPATTNRSPQLPNRPIPIACKPSYSDHAPHPNTYPTLAPNVTSSSNHSADPFNNAMVFEWLVNSPQLRTQASSAGLQMQPLLETILSSDSGANLWSLVKSALQTPTPLYTHPQYSNPLTLTLTLPEALEDPQVAAAVVGALQMAVYTSSTSGVGAGVGPDMLWTPPNMYAHTSPGAEPGSPSAYTHIHMPDPSPDDRRTTGNIEGR